MNHIVMCQKQKKSTGGYGSQEVFRQLLSYYFFVKFAFPTNGFSSFPSMLSQKIMLAQTYTKKPWFIWYITIWNRAFQYYSLTPLIFLVAFSAGTRFPRGGQESPRHSNQRGPIRA
ncbi:hypothetical protein ACFVHQ_10590 [Actinomycetes bacterium NPDC127524]